MELDLQRLVGQNIRYFRNAQRLTREEVAERVGISVPFYANIESGNRMMSIPTLIKIASVLQVSTDSLLFNQPSDSLIRNIELLLQHQEPEVISLSEKIVRVIANNYKQTDTDKEDISSKDECRV